METIFDPLLGVGSERADRALERRLLCYSVVAGPGPDLPYGQHRRAERIDVPTHDRLQAVDDLVGHHYGVDRLMGFARVSALTLDRPLEAVGGARHRASTYTHLSCRQVGPHVLREDDVRAMLPEHAVLHHPPRPTGGRSLLRRLEQEEHAAREFLPYLIEQPSCPYQHRRMGVVPAGVHHPVHFRDEGVIVLHLNWQRVNVRPQGHGLARSTPFYHAEHTRLGVAR